MVNGSPKLILGPTVAADPEVQDLFQQDTMMVIMGMRMMVTEDADVGGDQDCDGDGGDVSVGDDDNDGDAGDEDAVGGCNSGEDDCDGHGDNEVDGGDNGYFSS